MRTFERTGIELSVPLSALQDGPIVVPCVARPPEQTNPLGRGEVGYGGQAPTLEQRFFIVRAISIDLDKAFRRIAAKACHFPQSVEATVVIQIVNRVDADNSVETVIRKRQ